MYAKVENNVVVEWPIANIAQRFPNTSFPSPMTADALPAGYVMVSASNPPQVGPTQKAVSSTPVLQSGAWVQGWKVVDLTAEEIAQQQAERAEQVRLQRQTAYQAEADPLFFKWQRGEGTEQAWLDKIAEIKARFPE